MTQKRLLDILFALIGLAVFAPILIGCILIATVETKSFGLFLQERIGQFGIPFKIIKIKTLSDKNQKATKFGQFLRSTKIDELPQLINILNGTMSFVGPRPDIAGYADALQGANQIILEMCPGVTGLASLKYRNEEQFLRHQSNPLHYNDTVIWPDKVRINKWYVQNQTLKMDLQILAYTLFPINCNVEKYIQSHNSNH